MSIKYGYEGEGPRVGIKTALVTYPWGKEPVIDWSKWPAVWLNMRRIDRTILDWCSSCPALLTVGVWDEPTEDLLTLPALIYYHATEWVEVTLKSDDFVSVEASSPDEFDRVCELANRYARAGYNVFVIPHPFDELANCMLAWLRRLEKRVRVAPPIQELLGLP